MSEITLVLARADDGTIGKAGTIPWHISDDLRRFKALTINKAVIMGRKTWDSLPKKPLPQRTNIVVTRDRFFAEAGAKPASSLEDALALADGDAMIIGGAEIYRAALPFATRAELTEVHANFEGDVRLAPFDQETWEEIAREERTSSHGLRYSYVTLTRHSVGDSK